MNRIQHWLVVPIVALAAMPAAAMAGDQHKDKDKSNAAKACRAERGDTDASREAFAMKYGTAKSGHKNAFGKCVSQQRKARHDCREEREQLGVDAFRAKYGTEKSKGRNAFGKCVSKHAKHHGDEDGDGDEHGQGQGRGKGQDDGPSKQTA
jgi:hypothetical protein